MDYFLYYVFIGFVLNTGLALFNFYSGQSRGYIIIPHPFIYFLTIFAWPKVLWDLIAQLTSKDDDDASKTD